MKKLKSLSVEVILWASAIIVIASAFAWLYAIYWGLIQIYKSLM